MTSLATRTERRLRRRRLIALAVSVVVPVALVAGWGHRGSHAVRNVLVPGSGLYDHHLVLGLALTLAFVAATVAWVRAGVDWAPVVVVLLAVALSGALARDVTAGAAATAAPAPLRAAHEFPLVVLVVAGLGWARTATSRLVPHRPGRSGRGGVALADLGPVDRCHATAVGALAGDVTADAAGAIDTPDVRRRSARIGWWARGRRGGDPFRVDHAGVRAARSLVGLADHDDDIELSSDAARAVDGVPASEPGWVRLLDGTLAALALRTAGDMDASERWVAALDGRFGLWRGHRSAAVWTPLGLPVGHADPWEHSTALALVHAARWRTGDDDWQALRRRTLAAAARGAHRPCDQRLVAAGRVWLTQLDDPVAAGVLARPSIGADPLAAALDGLASRLATDPDLLVSPVPEGAPR